MHSFLYTDDIAVFSPQENISSGSSIAVIKDIKANKSLPSDFEMCPTFSFSEQAYITMSKVNEEGTFPRRQRTVFPCLKNYDFYGAGEQLGKLRKNGEVLAAYNRDNFMYKQGQNLYQAHPWVLAVGPKGESYGFLADSHSRGEIDLRQDKVCFEFEGEAHRVFVLSANSPQGVLKMLADLIGKITLPPKWALGYQQCRYSYMDDQEAKSIIDNFRKRDLACDVIWFDIDYMDKYKIFTFDSKAFPDPQAMNDYAHANNFKTVWMLDPGVKIEKDYAIYEELHKKGFYLQVDAETRHKSQVFKATVTASSNNDYVNSLIDGDLSQSWQASKENTKVQIMIDLAALCEVLTVDLYWSLDYPENYKVYTSRDSKKWDLLGIEKAHVSGGLHSIKATRQTQAQYLKIQYPQENQVYCLDQIMFNGESFKALKDIAVDNMFVGNVWPGPCAFPDFTNQECNDWWSKLFPEFISFGIDGVWNDMNEPAVFGGGPQMTAPDQVKHSGGLGINDTTLKADSHSNYHNAYGMLMAKASREGMLMAQKDKRPFVLTRANYLGGHRYAATWTGDNCSTKKHMKLATPMCLNLSLSGQVFVGPDLGGFAGDANASLFAEWMAIGVFYPFMRGHSSKGTNRKEPWAFGEAIEQSCRISLQRRYRLLPYLYSLFWRAESSGMGIMQPAFFADLTNRSLRKEENKFLLGDDLLIVPNWDKTKRFPKGKWKRISLVEGDLDDQYQASVYLREGAILALGESVNYTEAQNPYKLDLIINPDENGAASTSIYVDEGDGWAYKEGEFEVFKLNYESGKLKKSSPKLNILDVQVLA
ncbi:glycoside hydrolase family 31 protein [Lentisphaera profundi]|uniref:Glycoside hydrolase family 31 protein n=1 Tax=Lentisphaera profundi TaxID=1658616 RepID=A0ABY7VUR6_9BACT|nr:TIM-barrel domain-containing protein [Lentisphaera profundi]WDE97489.1 glycoside hydrolase family 31 protein [Lentisphaera profundi]